MTTAEAAWKTSTESLAREVGDLTKSHTQWAEALSNPGEQGALAEESLKVMLETAGFTKDVNFSLQQTETTDEGKLRPDVYVYTPDSGVIIIDSKGNAFYSQKRVGRKGKQFNLLKFRTMKQNSDIKGLLTIGKDSRITRIGHYLRKSKGAIILNELNN